MHGRYSIAVAGTHGKTTTSGLIAHMLVEAHLDPTYLIGGDVRSLGGNAAPGNGRHIVVEADEYDRAFLSYTPDVAIVTSIEADHFDIYADINDLAGTFAQFMSQVPADGHLITAADQPRLVETIATAPIAAADRQTYALDAHATWRAGNLADDGRAQTFVVEREGERFGEFTIELPGRHNVSNALAGIAAGSTIGIDTAVIRDALASYRGAQRRFEYIGEAAGVIVMDDYAHHPTEVRVNVDAARQRFLGRRLVVLFQPHTYSRTRYLLDEWKICFAGVDALYIAETYAAREESDAGLSGADLAREITQPSATYAGPVYAAARLVAADLRAGDVFFTMGAGDVNKAGEHVLELLRGRA
jgi:UDP-N-acetylmuramate--alanine ligase